MSSAPILSARNLTKTFHNGVVAVAGVTLDLLRGETLGIVGESGSGKSTTIRLILGLEKPDEGQVFLKGDDFSQRSAARERVFRRTVQFVPQSPQNSFNPRMTLEASMHFALAPHLRSSQARRERIAHLWERVGLPKMHLEKHPHELSGGQLQRAAIARALGPNPEILVCDEAVSALDKSVQAQVLNLLAELQEELDLSMLFISHDMAVIEHMSDQVMVMFGGKVVECGPVAQIYTEPSEPYTQQLLASILR